MARNLIGIFLVLHGLVHLWFVVLLQKWLPQNAMNDVAARGWNGESWLLTGALGDPTARLVGTVIFVIATVAFIVGGIAYMTGQSWSPPLLITSAVISALAILMFWDGRFEFLVEKGAIGVAINVGVVLGFALF